MEQFELKQASWKYYLNLDRYHFSEKRHNNIYTDAFEAGAEWEHKRLVERACEWLKKVLYIHNEEVEDKDFDWVSCNYNSVEEFIDNFVKATKE